MAEKNPALHAGNWIPKPSMIAVLASLSGHTEWGISSASFLIFFSGP